MKSALSVCAIWLLTLAPGAHAEPEFIRANTIEESILIVPEQECLSLLHGFTSPEEKIKDGLTALFEPGEEFERRLECFGILAEKWPTYFAPISFNARAEQEIDIGFAPEKWNRLWEIARAKACLNPYPESSQDFELHALSNPGCAGKWISQKVQQSLLLEEQALAEEYNKKANEWNERAGKMTPITEVFTGPIPNDPELLRLAEKLKCFNPHPEASSEFQDYQEQSKVRCAGKWLTFQEGKELSGQVVLVATKLQKRREAWEKDALQVLEFFLLPELRERTDALAPKFASLSCHNPFLPGTEESEGYAKLHEHCAEKWIDDEEAEKIRVSVREAFPNFAEKFAAWRENKRILARQREEESNARNLRYHLDYAHRRLVASFHAYGRKPGAKSAAEFCRAYEALERRDQKYAEQKHYVSRFHAYDWGKVFEHGLTEAEFLSIKAYTGTYFNEINPAIWRKDEKPQYAIFKEVLSAGLERLPSYTATPVIRESDLPKAVLEQHEVGAIVSYDAFTSSSKKQDWVWSGAHRFVIYSGRNGKLVRDFSSSPAEEEVLFQAGTRFKVLSKRPHPKHKDYFEFVMVEVDEKGNPLASIPDGN